MRSGLIFILFVFCFSFSRPMFGFKGFEKYNPDSLKSAKYFNENLIANRTHRIGSLKMTITNFGSMSNYNPVLNGQWAEDDYFFDECTGERSVTMEMPVGSGMEYLWASYLWCGGYLESSAVNVNGHDCLAFQGPLVSTSLNMFSIYSCEFVPSDFEDDPTGKTMARIVESSNSEGRLNCLFEEVYDPKATAYEQFTTWYSDKSTKQYTWDFHDGTHHTPLGIEVKQTSYAWPYDFAKKFIIVDYTIYNRNADKKDIYDFFIGKALDTDIGNRKSVLNSWGYADDISGYIDKWDGYIDPATGENKTVDMRMVWAADNDGREYLANDINGWYLSSEPGAGNVLDGAKGVMSLRVLRNPNPNLRFSFNLWTSDYSTESTNWGPRWKTGFHKDWLYDLTSDQKGYDDTNYDSLYMTIWDEDTRYLFGGITEGMPMGDRGRYMVMSNDEFDYNQTSIREVYLGMDHQADGTPIPQPDKWRPWVVTGTEPEGDISDGTIKNLNDLANGWDTAFLMSFGPFGYEHYQDIAVDNDHDGEPEDYINKKVWKFAYGDSLKLTLAFMVSDGFHTSLEQDPNYLDSNAVNLDDGLNVNLYDQGWYDAFYNVVWAERVFDTPMFDTPMKRWGETKKDGWFGEDVGADGVFGDLSGNTYCWWLGKDYPGPDTGEGDFEMSTFTTSITDHYGDQAASEDELLRYGRQHVEGDYGITGNLSNGDGYGYMVKYDKEGGILPQGTWIRYGFDNERLDAGDGVPDFTSPPPPPSPKIKVTELDNDIIVEWSSHQFYTKDDGSVGVTGPEFTFDPYTRLNDFEGYHIELSPDRQMSNFTTILSVDKMNYSYQNVVNPTDYYDNPIPADSVHAHPGDYPAIITAGTKRYKLVPFGDNRDLTQNIDIGNDMSYSCITAISPYPGWGDIKYYKFMLHNQTLAQQKFIAVTSSDYGAPKMGVPSLKSSPEANAKCTVTSTLSNGSDILVIPNPYRSDVDYGNMGWEVLDGGYTYREEYRKLVFLNIPDRCVIRIYTLAGDLCKVIAHNGNSGWNEPYWYGTNGAYWNLINDNNQAVSSGIYLFSVQDADNKKDDSIGKFVIIK